VGTEAIYKRRKLLGFTKQREQPRQTHSVFRTPENRAQRSLGYEPQPTLRNRKERAIEQNPVTLVLFYASTEALVRYKITITCYVYLVVLLLFRAESTSCTKYSQILCAFFGN
jgi:hypothetical protein